MKRLLSVVFIIVWFFCLASFRTAYAYDKIGTDQEFGSAIDANANNYQSMWLSGFGNLSYSISCNILGDTCSANPAQLPMNIKRSAVGVLGNVIAMTYTNQPADFGLWLADTGRSLGFIPNQVYAQAQGIGFSGLAPILPIWKVFRNVAYLLMAVVMIVIGFMVMLRKKIDPKTVVTAQNAIPRVIIALILITFSYAIVGLMIDLMYVVLFLIASIFQSTGYMDQPTTLYTQGNLWQNVVAIPLNPYKILFGWNVDPNIITGASTIAAVILAVLTFAGGGFVTGAGGLLFAAMPLVHVILAVAILFLFLKLFAFFLMSYIQIIISLLLGPLQLMTEAIPGSNAFSSWFRNLTSNLAAFVVGGAMFMLAGAFVHLSNTASGHMWLPPYLAIFGNPDVKQIASLISLGILFAITSVAGSVKEALKAKPVMPMLDMGGAGGSAMQWLSAAYYIKAINPGGVVTKLFGGKEPSAPGSRE